MKTRKDFVKKAVELAMIKNKAVRDAEIINYSTLAKANNPRFDESRFKGFVNEKVAGHNPSIYKAPKSSSTGDMMKMVKQVSNIGKARGNTPKQQTAWDKRMLTAGLGNRGLSFPDDFDKLPEKERQRRLKKVMELM